MSLLNLIGDFTFALPIQYILNCERDVLHRFLFSEFQSFLIWENLYAEPRQHFPPRSIESNPFQCWSRCHQDQCPDKSQRVLLKYIHIICNTYNSNICMLFCLKEPDCETDEIEVYCVLTWASFLPSFKFYIPKGCHTLLCIKFLSPILSFVSMQQFWQSLYSVSFLSMKSYRGRQTWLLLYPSCTYADSVQTVKVQVK